MEMSDIVREVREYIEEHGWCKGYQRNERGEVCIWGAYWMVANAYWMVANRLPLDGMSCAFLNAVSAGLSLDYDEYDDDRDSIVVFNDAPETTIEDVILHLKRVEERLS